MTEVFEVRQPGLLTTVQDLGRHGRRASGVPAGGAMDRFAIAAANRLVGNPDGAAALEGTVRGPVLAALAPCTVAITGGDFEVLVGGDEVPAWATLRLREGDVLDLSRRRSGARCYIALGGGFAAERWLGSASTYTLVGRGGFAGRPLRTADVLARAADPPPAPERSLPPAMRPDYGSGAPLAALPGPHLSRLSAASRRRLLEDRVTVSTASDRMGYRLDCDPLDIRAEGLLSFGVAPGCVQVPGSGRPILLTADHQTAGGYPVVLGVVRAGMVRAAQLLPGDEVAFRSVELAEAQSEWRRLRAALDSISQQDSIS